MVEDSWLILGFGLAVGAVLGALLMSIRQRGTQRQTSDALSQMQMLLDESLNQMPERFQQISAKVLAGCEPRA